MSGDHDACPNCGAGAMWCDCDPDRKVEREAYKQGAEDALDELAIAHQMGYAEGEAALHGECEEQRLLLNEAVVKLADCYEDYKKYRKASEEKDTRIAELKAALRDIAQIDKRPLGRYANGRSRGYEEYSTLSQQEMAKIAAAALKGEGDGEG